MRYRLTQIDVVSRLAQHNSADLSRDRIPNSRKIVKVLSAVSPKVGTPLSPSGHATDATWHFARGAMFTGILLHGESTYIPLCLYMCAHTHDTGISVIVPSQSLNVDLSEILYFFSLFSHYPVCIRNIFFT